jgi:hypothetical protein
MFSRKMRDLPRLNAHRNSDASGSSCLRTIRGTSSGLKTTVTTVNFDLQSVQKTVPAGTAAYVKNVTINGVFSLSLCHLAFYDAFRLGGGEVIITLNANKAEADDCLGGLPESISTGGFSNAYPFSSFAPCPSTRSRYNQLTALRATSSKLWCFILPVSLDNASCINRCSTSMTFVG